MGIHLREIIILSLLLLFVHAAAGKPKPFIKSLSKKNLRNLDTVDAGKSKAGSLFRLKHTMERERKATLESKAKAVDGVEDSKKFVEKVEKSILNHVGHASMDVETNEIDASTDRRVLKGFNSLCPRGFKQSWSNPNLCILRRRTKVQWNPARAHGFCRSRRSNLYRTFPSGFICHHFKKNRRALKTDENDASTNNDPERRVLRAGDWSRPGNCPVGFKEQRFTNGNLCILKRRTPVKWDRLRAERFCRLYGSKLARHTSWGFVCYVRARNQRRALKNDKNDASIDNDNDDRRVLKGFNSLCPRGFQQSLNNPNLCILRRRTKVQWNPLRAKAFCASRRSKLHRTFPSGFICHFMRGRRSLRTDDDNNDRRVFRYGYQPSQARCRSGFHLSSNFCILRRRTKGQWHPFVAKAFCSSRSSILYRRYSWGFICIRERSRRALKTNENDASTDNNPDRRVLGGLQSLCPPGFTRPRNGNYCILRRRTKVQWSVARAQAFCRSRHSMAILYRRVSLGFICVVRGRRALKTDENDASTDNNPDRRILQLAEDKIELDCVFVTSGSCESNGYEDVTDPEICLEAGNKLTWSSELKLSEANLMMDPVGCTTFNGAQRFISKEQDHEGCNRNPCGDGMMTPACICQEKISFEDLEEDNEYDLEEPIFDDDFNFIKYLSEEDFENEVDLDKMMKFLPELEFNFEHDFDFGFENDFDFDFENDFDFDFEYDFEQNFFNNDYEDEETVLCPGQPEENFCDGDGDCFEQPEWCSCPEAQKLCGMTEDLTEEEHEETGCAEGWTESEGECFQYVKTELTFDEAEQYCQDLQPGAHLATIQSKVQNEVVASLAKKHSENFIGLKFDAEVDGLTWSSGEEVNYMSDWHHQPGAGSTSSKCTRLVGCEHSWKPQHWDDWDCENPSRFFCSYSLPSCAEGWTESEGECFQYVKTELNFDEAEQYCQDLKSGAHLATIQSKVQNEVVASLAKKHSENFIGLKFDAEIDGLIWASGEEVSYMSDWHHQPGAGSTSSKCTRLVGCEHSWKPQHWDDWDCENPSRFFCSYTLNDVEELYFDDVEGDKGEEYFDALIEEEACTTVRVTISADSPFAQLSGDYVQLPTFDAEDEISSKPIRLSEEGAFLWHDGETWVIVPSETSKSGILVEISSGYENGDMPRDNLFTGEVVSGEGEYVDFEVQFECMDKEEEDACDESEANTILAHSVSSGFLPPFLKDCASLVETFGLEICTDQMSELGMLLNLSGVFGTQVSSDLISSECPISCGLCEQDTCTPVDTAFNGNYHKTDEIINGLPVYVEDTKGFRFFHDEEVWVFDDPNHEIGIMAELIGENKEIPTDASWIHLTRSSESKNHKNVPIRGCPPGTECSSFTVGTCE